MYYSFEDRVGGPVTYIHTILQSTLREKYQFATCYQNCAPGGLNFGLLRRMVQTIRREAPDIVHVHGLQSEGFYGVVAARLAGCRCIVTTVHGFAFDSAEYGNVKRILYRRIIEPLTLRLSDRVYCVCKYASLRSIVTRNAGKRNYGYIHNPVPFVQAMESRERMRELLGIPKKNTVFVISSRIVLEKGYKILEDAVGYLNQEKRSAFTLLVLGEGTYRGEFEAHLHREIAAGQVVMVGQTNRVADYLAAADVFILPSFHENLPIALLEAGKMGLPCIASAVGGIPEVITDGVTGFLVHGFDPMLYAQKMAYFMDHPVERREMSRNIVRDITNRFSIEHFCEEIDRVYV